MDSKRHVQSQPPFIYARRERLEVAKLAEPRVAGGGVALIRAAKALDKFRVFETDEDGETTGDPGRSRLNRLSGDREHSRRRVRDRKLNRSKTHR